MFNLIIYIFLELLLLDALAYNPLFLLFPFLFIISSILLILYVFIFFELNTLFFLLPYSKGDKKYSLSLFLKKSVVVLILVVLVLIK